MKTKMLLAAIVLLFASALCACKKEANTTPPATVPQQTAAAQETTAPQQTEATQQTTIPQADPAAEAISAYREILQSAPAIDGQSEKLLDPSFGYDQNIEEFGNHYDLFALADIDQNGIPELIALTQINFRWTQVTVFTFADGEAVMLKDPVNETPYATFDQCSTAGGAYVTYLCPQNHIHSVWKGTNPIGEAVEENYAYALSGKTLTFISCDVNESGDVVYFSEIANINIPEFQEKMG